MKASELLSSTLISAIAVEMKSEGSRLLARMPLTTSCSVFSNIVTPPYSSTAAQQPRTDLFSQQQWQQHSSSSSRRFGVPCMREARNRVHDAVSHVRARTGPCQIADRCIVASLTTGRRQQHMMAGRRAASWMFALLISCLLQPAAGFVGVPGLLRPAAGTSSRRGRHAHHSSGSSRSSTLHNIVQPRRGVVAASAGVGGLRAALEVDLEQSLEVGSVIVSGRDNYGHMTFKVCLLFSMILNKAEIDLGCVQ